MDYCWAARLYFSCRNKLCAIWIRFVACVLGAVWKFDEGNGHAITGDDDGFVAGVRERIYFNELHHSLCGKVTVHMYLIHFEQGEVVAQFWLWSPVQGWSNFS